MGRQWIGPAIIGSNPDLIMIPIGGRLETFTLKTGQGLLGHLVIVQGNSTSPDPGKTQFPEQGMEDFFILEIREDPVFLLQGKTKDGHLKILIQFIGEDPHDGQTILEMDAKISFRRGRRFSFGLGVGQDGERSA
jgi:hypothetical protein